MKTAEEKFKERPIEFLVDSMLSIEKLRVATQVRQTHLKLKNRTDPETNELLERLKQLEDYVDERVAKIIINHPAYYWFSQVKGVGKENIGKVVGLIDISKAETISAVWKYAGYAVENGKAPKRIKNGGKLAYNSQLRTMCWRLGTSLLKGGGKFYEVYVAEKQKLNSRFVHSGYKIVKAAQLPKKDGKHYEPENMISEGHIHNMAFRKMVKRFLSCLWLVWREAEGLPIREPYVIEKMGHTHFVSPWEMVDREEKKKKARAKK